MKILITGSTGMLGSELINSFRTDRRYEIYGLSTGLTPLILKSRQILIDLSNLSLLEELKFNVDVIIHTAAITNLSLCEQNPSLAHQVHVDATSLLANKLRDEGKKFIYISTDSIFDGTVGNYKESDTPNPLNVYSKTKFEGEVVVAEACPGKSVALRTNIYGTHNHRKGSSLAEWAINEWKVGKQITGFSDMIFNAVHTIQLAWIIKFIIDNDVSHPILNIGSSEFISKYDFLDRLRRKLGFNQNLLVKSRSQDLPSFINRPKNTSLNTTLLSSFHEVPNFNQGILDWINSYNC